MIDAICSARSTNLESECTDGPDPISTTVNNCEGQCLTSTDLGATCQPSLCCLAENSIIAKPSPEGFIGTVTKLGSETITYGDMLSWFEIGVNSECFTSNSYYTFKLDQDYSSNGISIDSLSGVLSIIKNSTNALISKSIKVILEY